MAVVNKSNRASISGCGKVLLLRIDTLLTDAEDSADATIYTGGVNDLIIDLKADKSCNVVITPLPDPADLTVTGEPSEVLLCDGTNAVRGKYTDIAAPNAKITLTKTGAGSMAVCLLTIRGVA